MTNMNTSYQWCICKIYNSFKIVFRWLQCIILQNCSHSITKYTFVVQSRGTVPEHPCMSLEAVMSYTRCFAHTAMLLLHQALHCYHAGTSQPFLLAAFFHLKTLGEQHSHGLEMNQVQLVHSFSTLLP